MVTGEIKNKIDKIWTDIWAGGITNPLTVIREMMVALMDPKPGERICDPACGSGNFLTESYTCIRRLENRALRQIIADEKDQVKVRCS